MGCVVKQRKHSYRPLSGQNNLRFISVVTMVGNGPVVIMFFLLVDLRRGDARWGSPLTSIWQTNDYSGNDVAVGSQESAGIHAA